MSQLSDAAEAAYLAENALGMCSFVPQRTVSSLTSVLHLASSAPSVAARHRLFGQDADAFGVAGVL